MPIPRDKLFHTDFRPLATGEPIWPVPPGTILHREFMLPNRLDSRGLAVALRVPVQRVESIVAGNRAISPETALRLARFSAHRLNSGPGSTETTHCAWHVPRRDRSWIAMSNRCRHDLCVLANALLSRDVLGTARRVGHMPMVCSDFSIPARTGRAS